MPIVFGYCLVLTLTHTTYTHTHTQLTHRRNAAESQAPRRDLKSELLETFEGQAANRYDQLKRAALQPTKFQVSVMHKIKFKPTKKEKS